MKRLFTLLAMMITIFSLSAQTTETMTWDDSTRQYLRYVPASYDPSTPAPVLFVLHGLGDEMTGLTNVGFKEIADQHGWIVIYPQATVATATIMVYSFSIGTAWNAGITINTTVNYGDFSLPINLSVNSEVDDAGFLLAILDDLIANYNVDQNNVFMTGFSMGGFMSNRMAIEHGDRIRAIASVSGTIGNDMTSRTPVAPINAMHIHGTADNTVSYDSAMMTMQGMSANVGIGAEQTVEFWRNFNQCGTTPQVTNYPDSHNDGLTFEQSLYTNGTNGTKVAFIKVNGGDHTWYYTPQNDIDYATEIYNFFASCMSPVGVDENKAQTFSVYPNPANTFVNIAGEDIDNICIYNAIGEKMLSTNEQCINVSDFANGLYLVRVVFNNGESSSQNLLISK